ncbi:MAG: hypothetical protein ACK4UP_11345 [Spirosomataceae bacterium]
MKTTSTLLLFFISFFLLHSATFAQDYHLREPESVEELLKRTNPNYYRAIRNKEKYLVVENLKNMKRKRIFIGDTFRFKTTDDLFFQEEVSRITDSTFTIYYYDLTSNRLENRTFRIDEVARVYKRTVKKGLNITFSAAALSPLLYDWAFLQIPPWQNKNTIIGIAALTAGNVVLANANKLFLSRKVSENYRIRVFEAY